MTIQGLAMESVIFCAVFCLSFYLTRYVEAWAARKAIHQRMNLKASGPEINGSNESGSSRELLAVMGRLAVPKKENELGRVRENLLHAGYREKDAVPVFYGVRVGLGLLLGLLTFMIMTAWNLFSAQGLFFLFLPVGMGYLLPNVILKRKIQDRRIAIFKELPDTLDLLMICLKAGLGFDYALYRVCRELEDIAPVLSREFGLYFLEVKSGLPRTQALDNLDTRNPSKSLKAVVTVIQQSFSTGTDIASALAVYTDALRTRRRQTAEEEGAKLSTKLTLPLVMFIMPALMLIILGPVIINFINMVKEGF